ncbi:transposase [Gemmiger sp.]|uniref:transposase n=1 Tax=Gemmiger sp. TaxID=2049027 RepID=UPI003520EC69
MQKEDKYASVKEEITTIYHENRGRYGYRRITAELRKRTFSYILCEPQDCPAAYERVGLSLPCQDEEVSLL